MFFSFNNLIYIRFLSSVERGLNATITGARPEKDLTKPLPTPNLIRVSDILKPIYTHRLMGTYYITSQILDQHHRYACCTYPILLLSTQKNGPVVVVNGEIRVWTHILTVVFLAL